MLHVIVARTGHRTVPIGMKKYYGTSKGHLAENKQPFLKGRFRKKSRSSLKNDALTSASLQDGGGILGEPYKTKLGNDTKEET